MLSFFFDSFEGFFGLLTDFFSLAGVACAICVVKMIFVRKD